MLRIFEPVAQMTLPITIEIFPYKSKNRILPRLTLELSSVVKISAMADICGGFWAHGHTQFQPIW